MAVTLRIPEPAPRLHVYVDEYHTRQYGLRFLSSDFVIAGAPHRLEGSSSVLEAGIITTVPEDAALGLEWLSQGTGVALHLYIPSEASDVAGQILESPLCKTLRIPVVESRSGMTVLSFDLTEERTAGISEWDTFLAGLRSGRLIRPPEKLDPTSDAEVSLLAERYLAALLALEEVAHNAASASGVGSETRVDSSALESALATAVRERDAERARYERLAASKLGRLTLWRWRTRSDRREAR